MGLFNFFMGDNKTPKNNVEKETQNDDIFGNICRVGQASDWYTEGYNMNLFENSHNVAISIETKTEDSSITNEQHIAGKKFLENIENYQGIITEKIKEFFNTDNTEIISAYIKNRENMYSYGMFRRF